MTAYFLLAILVGYTLGRIAHIFGGEVSFIPHHWIFGAAIIICSILWNDYPIEIRVIIFLFGLGLFVSDLKDFTALKIWEPEDVKVKRFWGID